MCVDINSAANGGSDGRGKSIWVDLYSMPGDYDDQLKWPAKAKCCEAACHRTPTTSITMILLPPEYPQTLLPLTTDNVIRTTKVIFQVVESSRY